MKSGRGGKREGAGRPPSGKKERITIQPTSENLEWLRSKRESNSSILNRLMDKERLPGQPIIAFKDLVERMRGLPNVTNRTLYWADEIETLISTFPQFSAGGENE